MRKRLKEWRKSRLEEEGYKKDKKEYLKLCEKKKKEERERWERKVKKRRENEVWKIVNKERRKRKKTNENIDLEE